MRELPLNNEKKGIEMTKGKLIEVLEALELLRVGIIDMQTASATGNEELFNDAFVKMQKLKPSATQAHEKLKAFIEEQKNEN